MEKRFFVYIMASKPNGTLYIGVTSDPVKRVWEHKEKTHRGFTARYGVTALVYFEMLDSAEAAIHREKRLKKYSRAAKIRLIEALNPEWNDLYAQICQ